MRIRISRAAATATMSAVAMIAGCCALAAALLLPLTAAGTTAKPAATVTPDTTNTTPIAAEQYYSARWAEIQRDVTELARPSVYQVQVVADRDWLRTVMECVSAYGLAPNTPNSYRISELICEEQYPSVARAEFESSVASRARMYDYYEHTLLPCLMFVGQRVLDTPAYRSAMQSEPFFWRVNSALSQSSVVHYRMQRCPVPMPAP